MFQIISGCWERKHASPTMHQNFSEPGETSHQNGGYNEGKADAN